MARLALRVPYAIVTSTGPEVRSTTLRANRLKVHNLSIAFTVLTLLLAATPALAIANFGFAQQFMTLATAIMLLTAAMGPQTQITTAGRLLKEFSAAILFPIFWMILQIIPLPSLANPVWPTTAIALNEPWLHGSISLDPAATSRSLVSYLSALSLVIATIIVTKDRQKAETTFLVLSAITTFMSAETWLGLSGFFSSILKTDTGAIASLVAASALGTIVSASTVLMAIERHLSQRRPQGSLYGPLLFRLFVGLSGLLVSIATSWNLAPSLVVLALAVGLTAIIFIAVARRFEFRPWPAVILFSVFLVTAGSFVVLHLQSVPSAGITGFITSTPENSLALSRRALVSVPLLGTGVGTSKSLVRIYQDFGEANTFDPPSTAVSVAIEWGKLALLIVGVFTLQLFAFIFRGAVRRGRDSFFASAAAAVVLVTFGEAFCDPSLLNPAAQIIVAVIVGLGISQSVGKTSGLENQA